MQSYTRSLKGTYTVSTSSPNGGGTSSSSVTRELRELIVAEQVTNGNRITTNPLRYTVKIHDYGHESGTRREILYGQPASQVMSGPTGIAPVYFPVSPDWAALEDSALANMLEQLRGQNNLIVDAIEGRQTLKLVKDILLLGRTLRKIVKDAKRSPLETASSIWLQYRYGVMPIVYSIYDALDTVLRAEKNRDFWVTGKSSSVVSNRRYSVEGDGSYSSPRLTRNINSASSRVKIACKFRAPQPGTKAYDWTSLNPFGIAWEVMPLSFVIDWAVDVSQYLSLWENWALFHGSFVDGYLVKTQLQVLTCSMSGVSQRPMQYWPNGQPVDGVYYTSTSGLCKSVSVSYHRTRLLALPLPKGIHVSINLNAKRVLDALSLMTVLTRRG